MPRTGKHLRGKHDNGTRQAIRIAVRKAPALLKVALCILVGDKILAAAYKGAELGNYKKKSPKRSKLTFKALQARLEAAGTRRGYKD